MSSSLRVVIIREVSSLLKEKREAKGYSMNRLAEMAGLSQQMVSYIERGMRTPTLDSLLRICGALDADLSEIIRTAESKSKSKSENIPDFRHPRSTA